MIFLAVDPGKAKCGWAVAGTAGEILARGICGRADFRTVLINLAKRWPIERIVLGDRTGHRKLMEELAADPVWRDRVILIDENRSSEEARRRCVQETTRGWRRLLPVTLRYPQQPYDDYVAIILAERYLNKVRAPVGAKT